jgi:hypothetical protein
MFFSRTSRPKSIKLGTNYPWVKGIQVCTNTGIKKSSSPEPAGQNQSNSTNYPWVKGIQVSSNKGPGPLQRGDNHKNVKMGWGQLKSFSPEPLGKF